MAAVVTVDIRTSTDTAEEEARMFTPVTGPAARAGEFAMTPETIMSFEWISGAPEWARPNEDRLRRSTFEVSPTGRFAMVQPAGDPVLLGSFSADGTFRATGSTGSVSAEIIGQTLVSRDGVRLNLTYASGPTPADSVAGRAAGTSGLKVYRATMTMRGIWRGATEDQGAHRPAWAGGHGHPRSGSLGRRTHQFLVAAAAVVAQRLRLTPSGGGLA